MLTIVKKKLTNMPTVSAPSRPTQPEPLPEPAKPGGWFRHVYLLNQVLQKMAKRGVPVDKDRLKELEIALDAEKLRLQNEIKHLLLKRESDKGQQFWGYKTDDCYKVLPKVLREELVARGTTKMVEKRTMTPLTEEDKLVLTLMWQQESANRIAAGKKPKKLKLPKNTITINEVEEIVPASYCTDGAKYPCQAELYEPWFWDFAIKAGFEWQEAEAPATLDIEETSLSGRLVSYLVAKESFNPASPAQLKDYCTWMGYKIPTAIKKTANGKESKETTDDKALEDLIKTTKDEMFKLIQNFREVSKLRSTYVEGWQPASDGRVHSTFTFAPATGQLSSRNPNVQNAPSHSGDFGKLFKKVVRAREGRVILNCVAPGTKVLMRDLTWKNAENIQVGDSILGFDELPIASTQRRYFRTSTVTNVAIQPTKRVKVVTDRGSIIVSWDHKFLKRTAGRAQWVPVSKLEPSDTIRYFTDPWETLNTYEAGWLSGFLDGEGYIGNGGGNSTKQSKTTGIPYRNTGLGFGQNDGEAADKAVNIINSLGYKLSVSNTRKCKQYHVTAAASKMPYAGIRLVSQVRPVRLLPKIQKMVEGMATWGTASVGARILQIIPIKSGPVVAISTTTKTLITNGFLSHNCDYSGFHAQMVGYLAESASFLRLSVMGVHDYLAAWMLKTQIAQLRPKELETVEWQATIEHIADLDKWLSYDDITLRNKLKWIKSNHRHLRDAKAKRVCHGVNFGCGAQKIYDLNKDSFKSKKEAEEVKALLFRLFPEIPRFQANIIAKAHRDKKLVSVFGSVRRFWEAQVYKSGKGMTNGEDAEKAIAFLPANLAFGIKKNALLHLEQLGANEKYHLFNEVHDSVMYEPLEKDLDEAVKLIHQVMAAPVTLLTHPELCPNGLQTEVEVSYGPSWGELVEIKV